MKNLQCSSVFWSQRAIGAHGRQKPYFRCAGSCRGQKALLGEEEALPLARESVCPVAPRKRLCVSVAHALGAPSCRDTSRVRVHLPASPGGQVGIQGLGTRVLPLPASSGRHPASTFQSQVCEGHPQNHCPWSVLHTWVLGHTY